MRALSLNQPFATLLAIGAKQWETRRSGVHIRGAVAIHATRKEFELPLENTKVFRDALKGQKRPLPLKAIVGVACIANYVTAQDWLRAYCKTPLHPQSDPQFCFGHFTPGYFAWKMVDAVPLLTPIPQQGQQGFFYLEPETEKEIKRQLLARLVELESSIEPCADEKVKIHRLLTSIEIPPKHAKLYKG